VCHVHQPFQQNNSNLDDQKLCTLPVMAHNTQAALYIQHCCMKAHLYFLHLNIIQTHRLALSLLVPLAPSFTPGLHFHITIHIFILPFLLPLLLLLLTLATPLTLSPVCLLAPTSCLLRSAQCYESGKMMHTFAPSSICETTCFRVWFMLACTKLQLSVECKYTML